MIIFKPDWVSHAGKPLFFFFFTKASFHSYYVDKTQGAKGQKPCIYSVDVHPDGTRLATGGLGTVRMT